MRVEGEPSIRGALGSFSRSRGRPLSLASAKICGSPDSFLPANRYPQAVLPDPEPASSEANPNVCLAHPHLSVRAGPTRARRPSLAPPVLSRTPLRSKVQPQQEEVRRVDPSLPRSDQNGLPLRLPRPPYRHRLPRHSKQQRSCTTLRPRPNWNSRSAREKSSRCCSLRMRAGGSRFDYREMGEKDWFRRTICRWEGRRMGRLGRLRRQQVQRKEVRKQSRRSSLYFLLRTNRVRSPSEAVALTCVLSCGQHKLSTRMLHDPKPSSRWPRAMWLT